MKKTVLALVLSFGILFAKETAQENILQKVLIQNTQNAIATTQKLQEELSQDSYNEKTIKQLFSELVFDWKKVETFYIAGEIDNDYLDTPRYVDIFHNLKENLNEQMQRARQSKDEANIALFKNSFKTINALEYILYSDAHISQRDVELSRLIVKNIQGHLEDILNVYQTQSAQFVKDEVFANGIVMNTLVQSAYKLKEWRIGDVAGLTFKYKNNPSANRAEYFLSKNSTKAMEAILKTHQEILDSKEFYDFGDQYEAELKNDDIVKTRKLLNETLAKLALIQNDDLTSKEAQALYAEVGTLYNHYFFSLIQDLKITAKILDADGD